MIINNCYVLEVVSIIKHDLVRPFGFVLCW